jgi:xylan 1,4-beta-xylosidase
MRDVGVRSTPDVNALASRQDRSIAVLVWNYHDDDLPAPPAEVELSIAGVPAGSPMLQHYRIDDRHSNAYEAWKRMGSPAQPSAAQHAELEKAGKLETLAPPARVRAERGLVSLTFTLPRQGVSLITLTW